MTPRVAMLSLACEYGAHTSRGISRTLGKATRHVESYCTYCGIFCAILRPIFIQLKLGADESTGTTPVWSPQPVSLVIVMKRWNRDHVGTIDTSCTRKLSLSSPCTIFFGCFVLNTINR